MVSPGWQPDPNGLYEYRYWDGTDWTDRVSNGGAIETAPLIPPPPPSRRQATPVQAAKTDDRDRAPIDVVVFSCVLPLFGLIYGPIALARGRTRSGLAALCAAAVAILAWLAVTTTISSSIGPAEIVIAALIMLVVVTPITYAINGS